MRTPAPSPAARRGRGSSASLEGEGPPPAPEGASPEEGGATARRRAVLGPGSGRPRALLVLAATTAAAEPVGDLGSPLGRPNRGTRSMAADGEGPGACMHLRATLLHLGPPPPWPSFRPRGAAAPTPPSHGRREELPPLLLPPAAVARRPAVRAAGPAPRLASPRAACLGREEAPRRSGCPPTRGGGVRFWIWMRKK
ncbi:hypothetical protein PVAP13_4NG215566 [Panicum virgatum]|uniref:Uncharacterized protein n=1 Tax=Panicum virgatum TaxID=38727 RepID=A0A8T0T6U3_PANVG|nr:hypothetical protein PVAP13_4NG215566 [Panicum virgatum]